MSDLNVKQVYDSNPTTTIPDNALIYLGLPPYGAPDDSAIQVQNIFPSAGVVADGDIVAFNGTSGKKIKKAATITAAQGGTGRASPAIHSIPIAQGPAAFNQMAVLATGQVVGGVTAGDPKPFTLAAGTKIDSIVSDTKASTITINATDQTTNFPITIDLHVSAQGNDTTGNGSLPKPYLTAKKAFDVILALGDFSASKNYNIYLHGVVTETAQIQVLPFCRLIGDGSLHDLGGFTLIHRAASWGGSNEFFSFNTIDYTGQTISFLLSALGSAVRKIYFLNCLVSNFNGDAFDGLTKFSFYSKLYSLGDLIGIGGTYDFKSGYSFNTISITNNNSSTQLITTGNTLPSAVSLTGSGRGSVLWECFGCDSRNNNTSVTISGNIYLFQDGSIPDSQITIIGSASVNPILQSQLIIPGFTPLNYTPSVATTGYPISVKNHLQGIDAALISPGVTGYDPGFVNNLQITRTSATTFTIAPGFCNDSNNTFRMVNPSTLTCDITVSGANGLDVGFYATFKKYALYLIEKSSDGSVASLFSLNFTTPTLPAGGYDKFRYVGYAVSASAGTVLLDVDITGNSNERIYNYVTNDPQIQPLVGGTATSPTPVDFSPLMSARSTVASFGFIFNPGDSTGNYFALQGTAKGVPYFIYRPGLTTIMSNFIASTTALMPVDATKIIDYFLNSSSGGAYLSLQIVSCIEYL